MSTEPRPLRDILAECVRRELRGLVHPLWAVRDPDANEVDRCRADHLMRLLAAHGVELVRTGNTVRTPAIPDNGIISRDEIVGAAGAVRLVRADGGPRFSILRESDGVQTVETSFTLQNVALLAGRVLQRDPEVRKEPNLLTALAASTEIYRLSEAPWIERGA